MTRPFAELQAAMPVKRRRANKRAALALNTTPSETFECIRFTAWLTSKGLKHTHVANESRSKAQAIKNKKLGTSPGVPDYFVLTPKGIVFVEMKRRKGGTVSAYQKEWLAALTQCNVPAKVCRGFDEAKEFVEEFL